MTDVCFGFEGGIWVLIAPFPGHCLRLDFTHFGPCEHYILKFTLIRGLIFSSAKCFLTVNELILSSLNTFNI